MKYFLAGIKGSGMASLASMLYDWGNEVLGCDDATYYTFTDDELTKRGIQVYKDTTYLTKDMIFIYTAAIHDEHPAVKKAKQLGCEMYGYFEMIGKLTKEYDSICISGTHGKTTTTAMLSNILKNTIGTNYLIGDGTGVINKNSKNFVVESCEFERHFLKYTPNYTVITNIELDHVDCYDGIDDIIRTFQQFVDQTKTKIIACGDDENILKLKGNKILYYGFNQNNNLIAKNIAYRSDGSSFDAYLDNDFYGHFNLNIYGKHMLYNALACIYICYLKGIDKEKIAKYLNDFKGAKRRFDEEKIDDVILVDDYAHHPTEVKTVIETSRQKYPDKEVVAVLIPYTISRTEAFYKEFADVLKLADKAYVTDIAPAREKFEDYPGITSDLIINLVPNAEHISDKDINKLYKHKNAIISFMGCKDSSWLRDAYKEGLK